MRMKKGSLCLFCIILMLMLTACDPPSPPVYHFQNNELENKIVKVEMIHYENPDQKKFKSYYKDHFKQLPPFNESNVTILKELPAERISGFLDQLSKTDIFTELFFFDSPKCLCIKLTYNDGSYLILDGGDKSAIGYVGIYSSTGEVLEYVGSFRHFKDWPDLINKYFDK